jgi:alpha-tubulin suppressor-like RCC1 family protein
VKLTHIGRRLGIATRVVALAGIGATATSILATGISSASAGGGEQGSALKAWGFGYSGQLGDGTLADQSSPVAVQSVPCATSAAVTYEDSFAVLASGKLAAFGDDSSGDSGTLGDGGASFPQSAIPITVPGISTAVQVAADIPDVFVLLANGTIEGWGSNVDEEFGTGESTSGSETAVAGIGGFTGGVSAIALENETALALLSSGEVEAWGRNEFGELGDGGHNGSGTPGLVMNSEGTGPLAGIKAVAMGVTFGLALTEGGEVMAWGGNAATGIGAGFKHPESALPLPVENPEETGPLKEVVAIAAGGNFALALLKNGTVVSWGADQLGQLGDGSKEEVSYKPVEVKGLTHIQSISGTELDGYALDEQGRVWAWGSNGSPEQEGVPGGELGIGSNEKFSDVPVQVTALGTGNTGLARGGSGAAELALGPVTSSCTSGSAPSTEPPPTTGSGTTSTSTQTSTTASTSTTPSSPPAPTSPTATAALALQCTDRKLTLTDVVERGGRVLLDGAAVSSLAGHKVKILFDDRKLVATATIEPDGLFSASAPLPPVKLRGGNSARYLAESDSLQSLDLKLTRRLILDPPTSSAGRVKLSGEVVPPLGKPLPAITVQQQLSCSRTLTVAATTPTASGRFAFEIPAPGNTQAAVYRLATRVRESAASRKQFSTFSLPEPVTLRP